MARRTRAARRGSTLGFAFITRDTVAVDTPARLATAVMVGGLAPSPAPPGGTGAPSPTAADAPPTPAGTPDGAPDPPPAPGGDVTSCRLDRLAPGYCRLPDHGEDTPILRREASVPRRQSLPSWLQSLYHEKSNTRRGKLSLTAWWVSNPSPEQASPKESEDPVTGPIKDVLS